MEATYRIEEKIIPIHCGAWEDEAKTIIVKKSEFLKEVTTLATIQLRGKTFYLLNYFDSPDLRNITCAVSGFNVFSEFIELQQMKKTVKAFEEFILPIWEKYLKKTVKHKIKASLPLTKWDKRMGSINNNKLLPLWML